MPAFKTITAPRLASVYNWISSIEADDDLTAYVVKLSYDLGLNAPVDAGITGHSTWEAMDLSSICESMIAFLEGNRDFQVPQSLDINLPRGYETALQSAPETIKRIIACSKQRSNLEEPATVVNFTNTVGKVTHDDSNVSKATEGRRPSSGNDDTPDVEDDIPTVTKIVPSKRPVTDEMATLSTKKRSLIEELNALTHEELNSIYEGSGVLRDFIDNYISYAADSDPTNEVVRPTSLPEVFQANINSENTEPQGRHRLFTSPVTHSPYPNGQAVPDNTPPRFDNPPASKTANHKQSFRLGNLTVVRNEDVPFLLGKDAMTHKLVGIAPLSKTGDMIFDAGKTHYWDFFRVCINQVKPCFQRSPQQQVSYVFINWNIYFQPEDYDKTTLEKLLQSEVRRGNFGKGPSLRYPPKTYLSLIQFLPVNDLNRRSQRAEKQRRSASAYAEGAHIGIDDLVLDNDMNRSLKSIDDAVKAVSEFILLATAPIHHDEEYTPVLHVMLVILFDFYEKRYKRDWEHYSTNSKIRLGSVILNAAMRCYHELVEVSKTHLSLALIQQGEALIRSSAVLLGYQEALLDFRRELEQGERVDTPIPYGLSSVAKLEPDKPVHNAEQCAQTPPTPSHNTNTTPKHTSVKKSQKAFWNRIKVEGETPREWGKIVFKALRHLQGDKPCLNFLRPLGCTNKRCTLTHKEFTDLDKNAQSAIKALAAANPDRMQLLKSSAS